MSHDSTYKPGDIVRLKCASWPRLVVESANSDGTFTCIWFDDFRRLCRRDFQELTITDEAPAADDPADPNDDFEPEADGDAEDEDEDDEE